MSPATIEKREARTASQQPPSATLSYSDKVAALTLSVVCFFLYFVGLDKFPILDPAEAYYVEACREMLQMGDYITPHLNYQIYFSKPILNFWLIAASYKCFGINEFAARVPFALLSALLVLATYWVGREIMSRRAGFIAGFCLATSPLLLIVSRKSSIDIAFTFFVNIAIFATALALGKRTKWAWIAVYASLALGLLTKGPAALVLYAAGSLVFLMVARPSLSTLKEWILSLRPISGTLLFLAIALPWHLAVSQATDGLFLKVFFWYENLARFQGHTNLGNVRYWFFLPVLGYGFFPWIMLLPPALIAAFRGWKVDAYDSVTPSNSTTSMTGPGKSGPLQVLNGLSYVRNKVHEDGQYRAFLLLACWSVTTFAFFSVSRTQLATYILPVIAPLALLVGALVDKWLLTGIDRLAKPWRIWTRTTSFVFAIAGVATVVGAVILCLKAPELTTTVKALVAATAIVFAVGGVKQLVEMLKRQYNNSFKWLGITIAATLAVGAPLSFHMIITKIQGDLTEIAIRAGKTQDKISMFGIYSPSAMFYSKKPVDTFFHGHQLIKAKTAPAGMEGQYPYVGQTVIVRDKELPKLLASSPCPLELVEHKGEWSWYRTPGYELESVRTLEDSFRDPASFNIIVSGKAPTGPLTVPYATGNLYDKYRNERYPESNGKE